MGQKLANRAAIVTGASKGIGAAIAQQLAAEGASVIVNYATSAEGAERVVKEIVKRGGKAKAVQASVTKQADIKRLFAETKKEYGKLDIVVNNAGVYDFAPIEEATEAQYRKQFDTNVLGLLLCCQEAVKNFGPTGGSIVNVSSIVVATTPPNSSIYSATKAAVDAITGSLAKELGARKIRVNSVNPGLVETEGVHTAGFTVDEIRRGYETQAPLGRIGQPTDIAPAVAFLVSDDASWITGETLYISGGVA